jgi:hypothetical protein
MRDESLITKILIFVTAFAFSACQKNAAENVNISPSPLISVTPTANPSATPNLNSPIRDIDFENFTYPWTAEMSTFHDEKSFTLTNGEREFVRNGQIGVSMAKIVYGDVTNDGEVEAFINLGVQTGGSAMPNMIYIYTLENGKPKLLWSFDTGDRAEGGFKKIYAENGVLVVELFGDTHYEKGSWIFNIPEGKFKGMCCPTLYTKNYFKWNGKRFVISDSPKLLDYDWKNPEKEN